MIFGSEAAEVTAVRAGRPAAGPAASEAVLCGDTMHSIVQVVLPDWSVPEGTMHFVYPSRRGMLPGVRALVDFLAERLPEATLRKRVSRGLAALRLRLRGEADA